MFLGRILSPRRDRIDKLKAWATAKKLVRPERRHDYSHARRQCEYDDQVPEFWVNVRTSGTLAREEIEQLSVQRYHDSELEASELKDVSGVRFTPGGFPNLGEGDVPKEGDSRLSVFRLWMIIDRYSC